MADPAICAEEPANIALTSLKGKAVNLGVLVAYAPYVAMITTKSLLIDFTDLS